MALAFGGSVHFVNSSRFDFEHILFFLVLSINRVAVEGSFAFSFVEGVLVKAVREGKWVLLDEINLASAETLQRLSGLLEVWCYTCPDTSPVFQRSRGKSSNDSSCVAVSPAPTSLLVCWFRERDRFLLLVLVLVRVWV